MLKRIVMAVAIAAGLLGATAAAQNHHPQRHPPGQLTGVRTVNLHRAYLAHLGHTKPGKIAGIVYARGKEPAVTAGNRTCAEPACPLVYQANNGPVQAPPTVYLVLWGPNWTSDPNQVASATYLQNFYKGLGARQTAPRDNWSTILSQYGDNAGDFPLFGQPVWGGTIHDTSVPPTGATQAQLAAEADTAAGTFGITNLADAQIVVATQSGTCPAGFAGSACGGTGTNCGWHSSSGEPYINMPYLLDAGTACGEDAVNPTSGTDDGFSLVGGDLYADTVTDPFPSAGTAPGTTPNPAWVDTADTVSGGEVASKCQWGTTYAGPTGNVTLSTGTFAMQSLWSNDASGCVMSDTVTVTSPGTQTNKVGDTVNLQLQGASSAGYPLTWTASGLPAGLFINSGTGQITGTPNTAATFSVTVTAADQAGTSRGVSFTWIINPAAAAGPVKNANGKCLDDSGGGTIKGTKADIWTCNGTPAQKWTYSTTAKTLSVTEGQVTLCLADHDYTGAGTKLVMWTCVGNRNEQWTHKSNGEYVLAVQSLCLTDPSGSTVNGTQVQIRTCQNFKDQHWSLP